MPHCCCKNGSIASSTSAQPGSWHCSQSSKKAADSWRKNRSHYTLVPIPWSSLNQPGFKPRPQDEFLAHNPPTPINTAALAALSRERSGSARCRKGKDQWKRSSTVSRPPVLDAAAYTAFEPESWRGHPARVLRAEAQTPYPGPPTACPRIPKGRQMAATAAEWLRCRLLPRTATRSDFAGQSPSAS